MEEKLVSFGKIEGIVAGQFGEVSETTHRLVAAPWPPVSEATHRLVATLAASRVRVLAQLEGGGA